MPSSVSLHVNLGHPTQQHPPKKTLNPSVSTTSVASGVSLSWLRSGNTN